MRRTKIVATVGPASRSPQTLERLVEAGVNVFRLNFSHGTHEEHLEVIRAAREIGARLHRPVALLQDLSGPKIRTGRVAGDGVALVKGARIAITTDTSVEGTAELISTTYEPLPRDVKAGDPILLDDGNLELRVVGVSGGRVECEVVDGGTLRSNKGMNLPGVALSTPALTEKDRRDLALRNPAPGGLRGDVLRASGRGRPGGEGARPLDGRGDAGHRQDREAGGGREPRGHPGRLGRRDGGARRPRGRARDRGRADRAEADHRRWRTRRGRS